MRTSQSNATPICKLFCLLLLAALLLPSVAQAQAIKGEDATEADGAKFQNERARQHMLELEERMFSLAERRIASFSRWASSGWVACSPRTPSG